MIAADRVALGVLERDRRRRAAADLELDHRAGVRERVAQVARVDGEGRRISPPP